MGISEDPDPKSERLHPSPKLGRGDGGAGNLPEILRLLGTTWLLEPDEAMLEQLREIPELTEIATAVTPETAALEYSRVVLQLVPPYASLFLNDAAMLNSAEAERVELQYRRFGFRILPEWRAGPADHLGLELHFLALLIDRYPDAAAPFLRTQVLPWAPICLLALRRVENARFYSRLATVTLNTLGELA